MTVVDASIVVRLLSARKEDDLLRQRFAGSNRIWHAPAHLDIAVYSAVVGLLKGSKVDEDRAHRMIRQFRELRITRHQVEPLGDRLVKLRHNFTAYDAAYIALAEVLRQPLLTCDAKFARAPSNNHAVEVHTFPG
ncbi:MAG: type II toxin-antitoxin system VapC family toxin [Stackebrandtia sp.]